MSSKPDIKPISIKEFEVKQSKYEQAQKLPVRGILLGPSGSGKGVLLQNMILDIYRDCFVSNSFIDIGLISGLDDIIYSIYNILLFLLKNIY